MKKPTQLTPLFTEALTWASQLHLLQERKGSGIPYLSHILGVASVALEFGADEDEAIAALLHDAVEDCGGAAVREAIRRRFGERVAAIVDDCTDTDLDPKPAWLERKQMYLDHLPGADRSAQLVSAADKLHNVRTLIADYREVDEALWERFRGKKAGTLWYYRSLVEAYRQAGVLPSGLLAELDEAVTALERAAGGAERPHPAVPRLPEAALARP